MPGPTAAALRPLRAAGPMPDGSWTDLDGLHMSSFRIKCPTYPDKLSDLTGCVSKEIVIRMRMMIMMTMMMMMVVMMMMMMAVTKCMLAAALWKEASQVLQGQGRRSEKRGAA
jgi:hypothetical protein